MHAVPRLALLTKLCHLQMESTSKLQRQCRSKHDASLFFARAYLHSQCIRKSSLLERVAPISFRDNLFIKEKFVKAE
jgi:hypothetical protein